MDKQERITEILNRLERERLLRIISERESLNILGKVYSGVSVLYITIFSFRRDLMPIDKIWDENLGWGTFEDYLSDIILHAKNVSSINIYSVIKPNVDLDKITELIKLITNLNATNETFRPI